MSRRDSSRVHIAVRQNDTLAEFENFKKKFLFANKQITKQNCSLSLKVEELNGHISTLYVENLRLRASEIGLQSQLKREKLKTHKIMADAEAATVNLLKHFGIIRQSYNVPMERPESPKENRADGSSPPYPRFQKPPPRPRSPSEMRLVQVPTVPDIIEDPEPNETKSSSEENQNEDEMHFVSGQRKSLLSSRRRASISRLPVPSRVSSPPPAAFAPTATSLEEGMISRKRKLTRRAGGHASPAELPPRPVTPILGSPMQQDIDLSAEEEAAALQDVENIVARGVETEPEPEQEQEIVRKKPRKKSRTRDESDLELIERRERRKAKDRDAASSVRLKDVTNSPRRRRPAAPSASTTDSVSEIDHHDQSPNTESRPTQARGPSLTISTPLKRLSEDDMDMTYLPTPLPSSDAEANGNAPGGRERRTRKSVNYAEPKLNTKMRKPDSIPPPGARPSLPIINSSSNQNNNQTRSSMDPSSELEFEDRENESEAYSGPPNPNSITTRQPTTSLATATKRRRTAHARVPSYSEDGTTATEDHDKDEREADDGTDGGEADSEFSGFRTTWANVNTSMRRKSAMSGNSSGAPGDVGSASRKMALGLNSEDGFGRRHSLAV